VQAYETEFAMLIDTSVIQVVSNYVTLIYFKFHPYGYYNASLVLCIDVLCNMFVSCIRN